MVLEIESLLSPFDLKSGEIAELPVMIIGDLLEDVKKLRNLDRSSIPFDNRYASITASSIVSIWSTTVR